MGLLGLPRISTTMGACSRFSSYGKQVAKSGPYFVCKIAFMNLLHDYFDRIIFRVVHDNLTDKFVKPNIAAQRRRSKPLETWQQK